jgi:predicted amidophosphoribosyltransferase
MKHTASQTKMSREERVQNVAGAFRLPASSKLNGKHVLLVDDVLTTGATLEEASATLLAIPRIRLSFMTIGLAMM